MTPHHERRSILDQLGVTVRVHLAPEPPPEHDHAHAATRVDAANAATLKAGPGATAVGERAWADHIGRYAVTGVLGRGGMGEVLDALDADLGRRVALKVIRGEADLRVLEKFVLEAQVCGQLEHPSIVPVHELGSADGRLYFTMKRVEGEDLAHRIARLASSDGDPRATRAELLRIFLKVCDALAFAHARGVVHRDLKPANVMTGRFGEVQVMDWGLAKVRGTEDPAALAVVPDPSRMLHDASTGLRTLDGQVMGTPAYMPPEQARGEIHRIGPASDVYALGAILYEMLAFVPPYDGGTLAELLDQVERGALVPPSERAPEHRIPRELEAVVLRAMATEPTARYGSVLELAADVEAFLSGHTLVAASYNPVQRAAKWAWRHRALTGAAAAVLMVSIALLVGFARDLEARRAAALDVADQALAAAPKVNDLEAERASHPERNVGGEYRESPEERAKREQALDAHLAALSAIDRALALRAGDPDAILRRADTGRGLVRLALLGGDYTLARRTSVDLERFRVPADEGRALTARVDAARTAVREARTAAVRAMVSDLALGLDRSGRPPGAPTLREYANEAAGYRDVETVELVRGALTPLIERARRDGAGVKWTQRELEVSRFACDVLGSLGASIPQAIAALEDWLVALPGPQDHTVLHPLIALCDTRSPLAVRAIARWSTSRGTEFGGLWNAAWAHELRQHWHRLPAEAQREAGQDSRTWEVMRAIVLTNSGDIEGARREYDRIIVDQPTNPWGPFLRGVFRFDHGNLADAKADYDRALALGLDIAQLFTNRGNVLAKMGDHAGALADYERAIALDPNVAAAYGNRAIVRRTLGDLEGAIEDYRRAIALDPSALEYRLNLGMAFEHKGDPTAALAEYSGAIELAPQQLRGYAMRWLLRLRTGDREGAARDVGAALALVPLSPDEFEIRAQMLRNQGDLEGAIRSLGRAIEMAPRMPKYWVERATAREAQGSLDLAEQDLTQALDLDPRYTHALLNRGNVKRRRGDLDGAIADYGRVIEIDPSIAGAYVNRGNLLTDKGDIPGALADYAKAIEADPKHADARFNRGTLYLQRRELEPAIADFTKAIELAPLHWPAHANLGTALLRAGRREDGLAALRRAASLVDDPKTKAGLEATIRRVEGK